MGDAPQSPITDGSNEWTAYCTAWQVYAAEWRTAHPDAPQSDIAVPGWPEYYAAWRPHWTAVGISWRTEPEIDGERQEYLARRRAIKPDIEIGVYPFRDENGSIKLTRADVEWLLATHESGGMRGPVDWRDAQQRARDGLDLRGAEMRQADLRGLPLAQLCVGLTQAEWETTLSAELRDLALANLAGAMLDDALLQGARLRRVNLERASLRRARLDAADLYRARLQQATLKGARLDGAICRSAHLEGANLLGAAFPGVDLRRALFDVSTNLLGICLDDGVHGGALVADARWDGVNLATVEWDAVPVLGDEQQARRTTDVNGKPKRRDQRVAEFNAAVRANRQLATVLRNQGLNEDADRYAYRAQVLQRQVLVRQGQLGRWCGNWLLDIVAGYGYKPMRSLLAYILIIGLFAGAYLLNAQFATPHLRWDEALVLSISSFHGRGFFTTGISLGDTLARLAAGEAIIGLLIEITFIATFTQRFFAR